MKYSAGEGVSGEGLQVKGDTTWFGKATTNTGHVPWKLGWQQPSQDFSAKPALSPSLRSVSHREGVYARKPVKPPVHLSSKSAPNLPLTCSKIFYRSPQPTEKVQIVEPGIWALAWPSSHLFQEVLDGVLGETVISSLSGWRCPARPSGRHTLHVDTQLRRCGSLRVGLTISIRFQ